MDTCAIPQTSVAILPTSRSNSTLAGAISQNSRNLRRSNWSSIQQNNPNQYNQSCGTRHPQQAPESYMQEVCMPPPAAGSKRDRNFLEAGSLLCMEEEVSPSPRKIQCVTPPSSSEVEEIEESSPPSSSDDEEEDDIQETPFTQIEPESQPLGQREDPDDYADLVGRGNRIVADLERSEAAIDRLMRGPFKDERLSQDSVIVEASQERDDAYPRPERTLYSEDADLMFVPIVALLDAGKPLPEGFFLSERVVCPRTVNPYLWDWYLMALNLHQFIQAADEAVREIDFLFTHAFSLLPAHEVVANNPDSQQPVIAFASGEMKALQQLITSDHAGDLCDWTHKFGKHWKNVSVCLAGQTALYPSEDPTFQLDFVRLLERCGRLLFPLARLLETKPPTAKDVQCVSYVYEHTFSVERMRKMHKTLMRAQNGFLDMQMRWCNGFLGYQSDDSRMELMLPRATFFDRVQKNSDLPCGCGMAASGVARALGRFVQANGRVYVS